MHSSAIIRNKGGINMKIHLTTGEVFTLDNDMKTKTSCTEWDVERFKQEGLIAKIEK